MRVSVGDKGQEEWGVEQMYVWGGGWVEGNGAHEGRDGEPGVRRYGFKFQSCL